MKKQPKQRSVKPPKQKPETLTAIGVAVLIEDDPEVIGSYLPGSVVYERLVAAGVERAEADKLAIAYMQRYKHLPLRRMPRTTKKLDAEALYGDK